MEGPSFEELIRKFNEHTKENPGEHLTPRERKDFLAGTKG